MKTRQELINDHGFMGNIIYESQLHKENITNEHKEKQIQSQIELETLLAIAKTHNFGLSDYLSVSHLVETLLEYLDDTDNKDDFLSVLSYKENELQ